jgi:hypothetical protein
MVSSKIRLSFENVGDILTKISPIANQFSYNNEKKEFYLFNDSVNLQCKIELPILMKILKPHSSSLISFINYTTEAPNYLLILIRSGYAAIGITEAGSFIHHKTIRKYMDRRKHGKSQITYQTLKKRTKVRGGGKLRLKKSQEFIEEINEVLLNWRKFILKIDLIFYQCSIRLWNEIIKKSLILSKTDGRMFKIPLTTYRPTFKELKRVNYQLLNGSISIKFKKSINSIDEFLSTIL